MGCVYKYVIWNSHLSWMSLELAKQLSGNGWCKGDHPVEAHLWMASRNGDVDTVRHLIDTLQYTSIEIAGVLLNVLWGDIENDIVCTPLFIASFEGNDEVVQRLLSAGASVGERGSSGVSPLHIASFMGHENVVWYLIAGGANVSCRGDVGDTALHSAARSGQCKVVLFLIEHGADVNVHDSYGYTPLRYAFENKHIPVQHVLLANGAI